ncbi:unnamed protein product, partial [Pylaiella littoralis]
EEGIPLLSARAQLWEILISVGPRGERGRPGCSAIVPLRTDDPTAAVVVDL